MLSGCTALETAEFGAAATKAIHATGCFKNCNSLTALILRSPTMVALSSTDTISGTPLTGYGGTFRGHVYVPSALIPEYRVATNWATLYANYPDIFMAIEGSEYE